jgi:hypothetical protein
MSVTDPHEQALRRLGPFGVAALLERLPRLAAAMRGDDPFGTALPGGLRHPGLLRAELPAMARVLAQPHVVIERLRWLDRFGFQLAALAAWHGGELSHEDALDAAGPEATEALDAAADQLVQYALAERDSAWLALLPGVAEWLGTSGLPVREYAQQLGSDDLAVLLRTLDLGEVAPRKDERIDQLEAALRDPTVVDRALEAVSEPMRRLLETLVEAGGVASLEDLDGTEEALLGAMYGGFPVAPTHQRYGIRRTPLHELSERGLLVMDPYGDSVYVPVDVQVTLRGGLFPSWPVAPEVTTAAVAEPGHGLPMVLGLLDGLLRRLERDPVDGLKSGGIGVRVIRTLAGQLDLTPSHTALLAHLAVELDLLGSIATSRGTTTRAPSTIWTTTAHADELHQIAPLRRWALLVQSWLESPALADGEGLPEKVEVGYGRAGADPLARRAVLDALVSLPPGQGVTLDGLVVLADHAHPTVDVAAGIEGRVAALRLLGLVPETGPIGLAALGRTLVLEGPEAAAGALPDPVTSFTVQPDHSIIAPPGLAPDVAARLDRYAVRESSGGASVHRLSGPRIAEALDAGESGEDVLAFLAEHSTADLPQNVEVLVGDVTRRHGQVKIGAAMSYVVADDPVLIADAVAHRAAKLRQLAPTVAVSSLPRGKLLATLAAKGMMPVAEGADGATVRARRVAEPEVHTPGPPMPPDGGLLAPAPPDSGLLELARELLSAAPTGTSTPERRRR